MVAVNEMNGVLGHLCAYTGYIEAGEPPEDGEMNAMTLSSRHRIRNSSPDGLRQSTLPLSYELATILNLLRVGEEETFVSLKLHGRSEWGSNPRSSTFQTGSFSHVQGTRPYGRGSELCVTSSD